jgi:hypothetical protein
MAIVHPAFCVVDIDSMEPIAPRKLTHFECRRRGYKSFQKPRVQLRNR